MLRSFFLTVATLLFIFSVIISNGAAQEYPRKEVDLTQLADDLYGFQDLDLNYEEIYENLALLLAHPIDLNKAATEELRFINVLTEAQIQNLIDYRNENGNFLSVYELQAVPAFDLQTIHNLISFVQVKDPSAFIDKSLWKRIQTNKNNYLLLRYERTLETKKGFRSDAGIDQRFQGSPDKLYLRFRTNNPGDFSIGFTTEKDQGEPLGWNPSSHQYGFDFTSFHAQLQNKGRIQNLIIGDYQSQFGQGLTFGGIFGVGKGGETITTTRRSNVGLLPYTSVNETGFFRGAAATISLTKNFYFTGLYSNTSRDGTLTTNPEEDTSISSFQTTGLHRNTTERSKRKQIGEQNSGAIFQYKTANLDAGILFHQILFDNSLYPKSNRYNQFSFRGRENNNTGMYLNYNYHNIAFFSELSATLNHGKALVLGTLASLTQKLDVSLVYRKYDKDFYSFYANAFSESSSPQNETGMYWGWKYRFSKKLTTTGYFDFFRFPWLKYRTYAPSAGHEWLFRIHYRPARSVQVFVQAREEVKTRNLSDDDLNLYHTAEGKKHNFWINFDYEPAKYIRLKTRLQHSTFNFNSAKTRGFVVLQDLGVNIRRFKFTARYALFDTDDYDNRQYIYENDVWLAYSFPAYYGKGIRKYLLTEYTLNKHFSFWLRFAATRYTDRNSIGSGVDTIDGNTRNDIKFETRIRF